MMAGSLSGVLLSCAVLVSHVLCVVLAGMWVASGIPSQPTPEPYGCWNPGNSGCQEHLTEPCIISCGCGPKLVICSRLRSCQEPGLPPSREDTADQCRWLGVCHSWCISLLVSSVGLLDAVFPQKASSLRLQRNGRRVVAAVAVIYAFVPRRCGSCRDWEVDEYLGKGLVFFMAV